MIAIDVRDLVGRPGSSRAVRVDEPVEGLALELAAVPEDMPIEAELLLESVVEGILVSGPVRGAMQLSCARCLKRFEQPFALEVSELFAPQADPDTDDYELQDEGAIDVEPLVRDTVLLEMPFSPLCRPDCKGLCERCGGDRNLGECTCPPITADPRWSVLNQISFE
ncbi:MAG: DUF177 domain-containing protein [Actinomycetota bacterium]